MKRYIVFLFCILTGTVVVLCTAMLGSGVFAGYAADEHKPGVTLSGTLSGDITAAPSDTAQPDTEHTVFRALELPDDTNVPQYYTTVTLGNTECFAFTDARGDMCYRVYGELEYLMGDRVLKSISGFFRTEDGVNVIDEIPVNPDTENYGVAVLSAAPDEAVPTGYVRAGEGIYYFQGANRERVYRAWASFGDGECAFYPSDAQGTVAPGAVRADIDADIKAMEQGSLPVSVVTAPHIMIETVEITTLINMNNRLDKDYVPKDLVSVGEYLDKAPFTMRDNPTLANPEALEAFLAMVNAANAERGIKSFYLCNVYRSYDRQTQNWQSRVNSDPSYGTDPSKPIGSAYPGTSEHQTGLAFDITCLSYKTPGPGFASTKEAKWLGENSWRFGFILRYQKGKESLTGIKYEPYHFRYVGRELAEYLYNSGLCLEEYYDAAVVWSGSVSSIS